MQQMIKSLDRSKSPSMTAGAPWKIDVANRNDSSCNDKDDEAICLHAGGRHPPLTDPISTYLVLDSLIECPAFLGSEHCRVLPNKTKGGTDNSFSSSDKLTNKIV